MEDSLFDFMISHLIFIWKKVHSRRVDVLFLAHILKYLEGVPVSAVFGSPANRTIGETALIGDRFSTKMTILDFWIFKVHFFSLFSILTLVFIASTEGEFLQNLISNYKSFLNQRI